MAHQVVMSKANAQLAIAIPLYQRVGEEGVASLEHYVVSLTAENPIAYIIDNGEDHCPLINAALAHKYLHFLGDL